MNFGTHFENHIPINLDRDARKEIVDDYLRRLPQCHLHPPLVETKLDQVFLRSLVYIPYLDSISLEVHYDPTVPLPTGRGRLQRRERLCRRA